MNREVKISICTVCMNRLHHLKETLEKNINDNSNWKNLEHIVLDYNSQDGMENWVKDNLSGYIENGRLIYYKTFEPLKFNMAHSKNMVAKLGTGDIICLVDADNYTGLNYANYIDNIFQIESNCFATTIGKKKVVNALDVYGRVCFKKGDFTLINGFDEFMQNYGYDDIDFTNRLELLGRKRVLLKDKQYLKAIQHEHLERIKNQKVFSDFQELYISHINPSKSDLLFLFNDATCCSGTIFNKSTAHTSSPKNTIKPKQFKRSMSLVSGDWVRARYNVSGNKITLIEKDKEIRGNFLKNENISVISIKSKNYIRTINEEEIEQAIYLNSTLSNLNKLNSNLSDKIISPNNNIFGRGVLYKNFNYNNRLNLQ